MHGLDDVLRRNLATLEAFAASGRRCVAFVAHDIDHDNRRLLADRRVSAVLHHDLDAPTRVAPAG